MVVRTNVLALNSHRNLGNVGRQQAQASARLSSGFRINSAADDAAGLGISENMRAQIRGLDQASRNAQDGISLVQTAEGGLSTINEMIIRIRELTVQASNDINTSEGATGIGDNESNRARIQGEINHLIDEIQRTATTLQFNGMTLLDGSFTPGAINALTAEGRAAVEDFLTVFDALINANTNSLNAGRNALAAAEQTLADIQANRALVQSVVDEINALTSGAALDAFRAQVISDWANHVDSLTEGGTVVPPAATTGVTAQRDFLIGRMATHFGITAAQAGTIIPVVADAPWDGVNGGLSQLTNAHLLGGTDLVDNMVTNRLVAGDLAVVADAAANATFNAHAGGVVAGSVPPQTMPAIAAANLAAITGNGAIATLADLNTALGAAGFLGANNITAAEGNIAQLTTNSNAWHNALSDMMRTNVGLLQNDVRFDSFDDMMAAFNAEPGGQALWFQIGANSGQGVQVELPDIVNQVAGALRETFGSPDFGYVTNDSSEGNVAEGSGQSISALLSEVDAVLATATAARGALGAIQNRLEFTIQNLDVSSENLSAANSRIRDTDMAAEMMRLTQANVLQQAATAMLAQGNQAPQAILQLLG